MNLGGTQTFRPQQYMLGTIAVQLFPGYTVKWG